MWGHLCGYDDSMFDFPIVELKALADTARLRILLSLPRRNICALVCNVSELAADLRLPQSTWLSCCAAG